MRRSGVLSRLDSGGGNEKSGYRMGWCRQCKGSCGSIQVLVEAKLLINCGAGGGGGTRQEHRMWDPG